PGLTNYISLPGRYLVMVPDIPGCGVSRKIGNDEERRDLKQRLLELEPPKDHGFIVRTAGMEVTKRDMQRDLSYLTSMWKTLTSRGGKRSAPTLAYEEQDIVIRTVRDIYCSDIDEMIIDSEETFHKVKDFLKIVAPKHSERVKYFAGKTPIFHRFDIEVAVESIYESRVPLKSGGSIVIEQTEALVAIDINSGKFTDESDPEDTAFKINSEAAIEIARQVRLRDLGGVIVIDFIDMRNERNRKEIEKILHDELRKDRAKTKALRMSRFCLVEMTRQRMRTSLRRASYNVCHLCEGTGYVKNVESQALFVMRRLRWGLNKKDVETVDVVLHPEVASYIQNVKRRELVSMENLFKKSILISSNGIASPNQMEMSFFGKTGQKILLK
ncbi:MAG: Rne/Rng family ribonuclease, partial [Planctomycetota bacterium]|nr:Rne/Rng family ribonuclease [Planctomycetota bacterium]